ncbi:MAG: hypothetical protein VX712_08005 [Bacteroidota bacterium]|nr:hypothetical protein [Bacteroidota bacterium]
MHIHLSNIWSRLMAWVLLSVGILNIIRGNDVALGILFMCLSIIFFPVTSIVLRDLFAIRIPNFVKIALAFLLLWICFHYGALAEGYYPEIRFISSNQTL